LGGGYSEDDDGDIINIGGVINRGNVYELAENLQLVYGVSAGIWISSGDNEKLVTSYGIAGPFIRLRWYFVELMYRGLLGVGSYEESDQERTNGIAYDNQITLGLHFATSNRYRRPPNARRYDNYFAVRYQIPGLRATPSWGALNAEYGKIWGNGAFLGVDGGGGFSDDAVTAGASINLGNVYDLPIEHLQLVYGMSTGLWVLHEYGYDYNFGFFGPFIRLRWHFVELAYRGLLSSNSGPHYDNQLMLGLYFATSERVR
jgi:hypothetical protein